MAGDVAPPQAGTRGCGKENCHMQDHQGHQVPLADHIRGIVPDRIPNGTKEGIYQAFLELAELAELGVGQRQGSRLHRTVQFLEQALDSLRCPENPGRSRKGSAPLHAHAVTPERVSLAAGTRPTTPGSRPATARPRSTCPVSVLTVDERRLSAQKAHAAPSCG